MDLTDHKAIAGFLFEAAAQQWNWVTFDRSRDQPVFHGYVSAGEASVQWRQDIEPHKEVKRFLVIEHTHPGHHICEIGHEVGILKYFGNQADGESFLREKAKGPAADKKPADLILAGNTAGVCSSWIWTVTRNNTAASPCSGFIVTGTAGCNSQRPSPYTVR